MTNKEALVAVVQVSVSDNTLEKALLDQDITSGDTYAATNSESIDLAAISVLEGLLSSPNVSEGGFSISYDRKAVEGRIKALCQKHSISIPNGPTVKDASNRW